MSTFPHYIFGYGSLICPASRAITAPTLQRRVATPVRVRGLERLWSLPVVPCGTTFLGIRPAAAATCVGVLIPVNDEELAQFDAREIGYTRTLLALECIEKIAQSVEKNPSCYFDHLPQVSLSKETTESPKQPAEQPPKVWVYAQNSPAPINPACPLAQTYVDIIMRGCLTISTDFCREFLQTTRGWTVHDFDDTAAEADSANNTTTYWVDDRHAPLYVRADPAFSLGKAEELDRLLQQHRPEIVHRRPRVT